MSSAIFLFFFFVNVFFPNELLNVQLWVGGFVHANLLFGLQIWTMYHAYHVQGFKIDIYLMWWLSFQLKIVHFKKHIYWNGLPLVAIHEHLSTTVTQKWVNRWILFTLSLQKKPQPEAIPLANPVPALKKPDYESDAAALIKKQDEKVTKTDKKNKPPQPDSQLPSNV